MVSAVAILAQAISVQAKFLQVILAQTILPQTISTEAILTGSGAFDGCDDEDGNICKVDGDGGSLLMAGLTMSCDECCDGKALLLLSGGGDGVGCDGEC